MSKAEKSAKPAKGPKAMDNPEAMRLAETTDLSPNQADALLKKHGGDAKKVAEIAKTKKAES